MPRLNVDRAFRCVQVPLGFTNYKLILKYHHHYMFLPPAVRKEVLSRVTLKYLMIKKILHAPQKLGISVLRIFLGQPVCGRKAVSHVLYIMYQGLCTGLDLSLIHI